MVSRVYSGTDSRGSEDCGADECNEARTHLGTYTCSPFCTDDSEHPRVRRRMVLVVSAVI